MERFLRDALYSAQKDGYEKVRIPVSGYALLEWHS